MYLLFPVNLAGLLRPEFSRSSTKILTIYLVASDRYSMLMEGWLTQMLLPVVLYPGAVIIEPRQCRTSWNSARRSEWHAGYLPGYPASHGCVRLPRDAAAELFERVHLGTPVTVMGSTHNLARVRKAIPVWPSVKVAVLFKEQ